MLEARNLAYGFRQEAPLFAGLDIEIAPGQSFGIVGPSGSGKSTLLKLLAGKLPPQEGEILFDDKPVITTGRDLTFEKDFLFSVEQGIDLPAYRSVRELFHIRLRHLPAEDQNRRIDSISRNFGIDALLAQATQTLSLGQAQRVGLALSACQPNQIILLDEPFSHQDPLNRQRLLFQLIRYGKANRLTYIVASHSAEDCMILTDRCLHLDGSGFFTIFSNWEDFFTASDQPQLRAYFEYVSGAPLLFGNAQPDIADANQEIETRFLGRNQLSIGYDGQGNPSLQLMLRHTAQ